MSRALIIDDSASFRASARALLEAEGFKVAEAATGGAGIRLARELQPELVLLDIQLPDVDGFEVADRLGELKLPPAVVLISSRDRADYGSLASRSPARGFIPKSELSGAAIRSLLS
jgi:DNA-binding NarL/FixJ family response regulator